MEIESVQFSFDLTAIQPFHATPPLAGEFRDFLLNCILLSPEQVEPPFPVGSFYCGICGT
jgi:hypothetical protein